VDAPRPVLPEGAPIRSDEPVRAPRPPRIRRSLPIAVAPEQVPGLVEQLDSDEYRSRQQATRLLKEAGQPAVRPLMEIAHSGSLEAAVRSVRILESIYIAGDDPAVDAAESALEELQQSPNASVAARAEKVLVLNSDVRERRAVEQIRRLGGEVQYDDYHLPDPRFPDMLRQRIQHVILDQPWRGGDEGLKYIRRLENLDKLYIIDGVGAVSPRAEQQLAADMPNLQIQHRSRACLGVAGMPGGAGCLVSGVKARSAADRAGIQPGDIITRFGGKEVSNFDAMVQVIYDYKPGDRVEVEIDRRGEELKLEVVMDGWTDLGTGSGK
jgi:hypothetical protein